MEFADLQIHGHLVLKHVGRRHWRLTQPIRCTWVGGEVEVPAGFQTDLASVPRPFRSLISVVGDWNRPAVIHDWLYCTRPVKWTRRDADRLFLACLRAEGVWSVKRALMYAGVRLGGWWAWEDAI